MASSGSRGLNWNFCPTGTDAAVSYVTLLKALTGRSDADVDSRLSAREQSESWRFGILRGGVYNGWPSGHVGTTTAAISTLMHYYPGQSWLKWMDYPLIGYMVASVTLHARGQMHWLSKSVAGALMGYAIGWTVGSKFRDSFEGGTPQSSSGAVLSPLAGSGPGIQFSLAF